MQYLLLFLSLTLYAQGADILDTSEKSGATGSIGTITINGQMYNQLSLRPEIQIGKIGVGLDIYLYFNDQGMYWESWDFSNGGAAYRTIIDKIYYFRWGQPGDSLFFMVGALPSVTLGQGIFISNYANIMEYPQVRQLGLNFQARAAGIGIELIHSNLKTASPGVLGIRGSYLGFSKLSMGVSYVTDSNQLAGLSDADDDGYPDYYDYYPDDGAKWDDQVKAQIEWAEWNNFLKKQQDADPLPNSLYDEWFTESQYYNVYNPEKTEKDPISGIGFDVAYSLNEKITLYSQIGALIGEVIDTVNYTGDDKKRTLGWGLAPVGARAKLGPINMLAEYRIGFERFVFNYWDRAYDVNRVSVDSSGIVTRESQLYQFGKLNGYYVQLDMDVINLFSIRLGYQNMQGEKWDKTVGDYKSGETNQTFLSTIAINPSIIPRVGKAEAFYQQSNVPNPFDFLPSLSTLWGYNMGFEVSSGIMLVYQARTTYISNLDNSGEFEPVESIQIETQFIF